MLIQFSPKKKEVLNKTSFFFNKYNSDNFVNIDNDFKEIIKLMKNSCNNYYITCIFAYIHIKIHDNN